MSTISEIAGNTILERHHPVNKTENHDNSSNRTLDALLSPADSSGAAEEVGIPLPTGNNVDVRA